MYSKLEEILKKINDDDLKTMFQTAVVSIILQDRNKATTEIKKYARYNVPTCLGDIIEIQDKKYCVTCVYTDNTVDLLELGENPTKHNIGLYKREIKIVGKLQVIKED